MKSASIGLMAAALGAVVMLSGCERPPVDSSQTGYRGLAMGQVTNPRIAGPLKAAQPLPVAVAEVPPVPGAPLAKDTYRNLQVLGDLSVPEFARTMLAITSWVAPQKGCTFCHVEGDDFSLDRLYTKTVARKMLAMTQQINTRWKPHVAETGVTCYTCHRGQAVPPGAWVEAKAVRRAGGFSAESYGQNHPLKIAGLTAMGGNLQASYYVADTPIRTEGTSALPAGNIGTIRQTEETFGLMINMSESLGVNCTFCHNTRSLGEWPESPMQRTTAFHGLRMVRELNKQHVLPLAGTLPKERLGPMGDVPKVNCSTCHQGQSKPLGGAPLLKQHPVLGAQAAAVPAAATTPVAMTPGSAVADGRLASIRFASGKDAIDAEGAKAIAGAAAALKADARAGVALSGFADRTGNPDANLELAKRRAFAVRDALKAAGVDTGRIQLKKPEFVIGGADADSRRVDIIASH